MVEKTDILEILGHVDPSILDYSEWIAVGMALKEAGKTASDWDEWSRRDAARYHPGECFKKWTSFSGSATPVTAGTIVQMAKDQGWAPEYALPTYGPAHEIDWDDAIGGGKDDLVIVDRGWLETQEVVEPKTWDPVAQLTTYLETLFEASEQVGYVTESWEKDGRYMPSKGAYDRTAGQLIQELNRCGGDIGSVIGDYNEAAGAWIRFNPLDGKGVKNENVTDYRYALVESDTVEIDRQYAILRELELPIACLVHSGKKSLHAIVKIDATNYDEYRKRVDYLYAVLKKNGMDVDTQNKNPSRLSRMPGIMRNGRKQYIVDKTIGKASWMEWHEWIESVNDDLPDPESMASVWDNLPELSPPLITNVLRQGHKMLLAGPSKAGKSYLLIELCCAIAEGRKWLGWDCTKGKIMYVNLELDRASCLHRFKDVYAALGWQPSALKNIDIWNLRGKAVPMDKLAPKLIRRASKRGYIAIIIDPIYKVITGDENSADQMAAFCNQFDRVCSELGAAVIYCHHHSKGTQGQKRSMDRASGSGVFARDPDALLDLIELGISNKLADQEENKAIAAACCRWMEKHDPDYDEHVSQDDACSQAAMQLLCKQYLPTASYNALQADLAAIRKALKQRTAWRVEGTLREFPKFDPVNLWFDYPVHHVDNIGSLKDMEADSNEIPQYAKNFRKQKTPEERKAERVKALDTAYDACGIDGEVTIRALTEYMGATEKTVRNRLKEHGGYWVDEGKVGRK